MLLGVTPAVASDLGTPTLGDDSAYTLTKVDAAGENTITKFEYNTSTGEFTPVYYRVDLKQTEFGTGDNVLSFDTDLGTIIYRYNDADLSNRLSNNSDISADTVTGKYVNLAASSGGGAIYNTGTIGDIVADFVGNKTALSYAQGGAIFNQGNINGHISGDFIGNVSSSNGGAIRNYNWNVENVAIEKITGNFINNSAYSGGAISNNNASIGDITGHFINNTATASSGYGGAIEQIGNAVIGNITGDFINNSARGHGGAIYNRDSMIGDIKGDFIGNAGTSIVYNTGTIGDITGDFINNTGDGIYNTTSTTNIVKVGNIAGNFINNTRSAINNSFSTLDDSNMTLGSISGNFIGNKSSAIKNQMDATYGTENSTLSIGDIKGHFLSNSTNSSGGAIYNYISRGSDFSNIKIGNITGDFVGNTATDDGGAIYMNNLSNTAKYSPERIVATIKTGDINGNFINNSAGRYGGAIYSYASVGDNIIGDITSDFIGNSAGSAGGAIYMNQYGSASKIGDIKGDFKNNYVKSTSSFAAGGAIYGGYIKSITGDFVNNYVEGKLTGEAAGEAYGGAIYGTSFDSINGNFIGNYAKANATAYGGAIYNTGYIDKLTGDFENNYAEAQDSRGGAIYNDESYINLVNSSFVNNKSGTMGGAIYTMDGSNETIGDGGGAVGSLSINEDDNLPDNPDYYTYVKNLDISSTLFKDNSSGIGGAIASELTNNLTIYTGGAEPPEASSVTLYSNDAQPEYKEISINIENSSFQNNKAVLDGGAISINKVDNITIYAGNYEPAQPESLALNNEISLLDNFSEDYYTPVEPEFKNYDLVIKDSEFTGNTAARGGAISFNYNKFDVNIMDTPPSSEPRSLSNDNTGELETIEPEHKLVIENTNFVNNSVALPEDYEPSEYGELTPQGGAIYTSADTKIVADNGNSIFSNNTVTNNGVTQKNDIYIVSNTNSTINVTPDENNWDMVPSIDETQEKFNPVTLSLEAKNNGTISFDGTIDGEATYSKAIIYEDSYYEDDFEYETEKLDTPYAYNLDITGDDTGRVIFKNDVKNANVTIADTNVYFDTRDNIFDGNNLTLKSGMLSMVNGGAGVSALNTFTISGDTNFVADVNLQDQTMDRITADTYGEHTGNINVVGMNILNDAPVGRDTTEIFFAETGLMDNVVNGTGELPDSNYQVALTPIYKYNVGYETREDDGGYFIFTRGDKIPTTPGGSTGGGSTGNPSDAFNPAVLATPVGNLAAGQAAMNEAFKYVFEHADAFTQLPSMERYAKINANKYALSTDFNENLPSYADQLHNNAVWFRPYTTFETMNIKNGPKVDAITYGSLVGFDGDFKEMKNGWSRIFTGYAGYMGSSLNYSGVDTTMNGGLLGFTETFYKGNFWTAITASAGASVGESHTMYGKEDYTSLLAGVGSKTGYNFEFKDGKFIIQPIMFLSYTFVNTFDYKNAAGVNIESDPLHTIQLNPSVRFIANLKGGWQPYASVGMVWNLMNESKVTANNVKLPEMSVKPYVEYGVGVQRNWADKFTAFLQAMIRNGGRNGVALTGGFRFMLGSDSKNSDKPKVKKEIKSL